MTSKFLLILALAVLPLRAQQTVRWVATTGDVALVASATSATIQQPAVADGSQVYLDQVVVYCSVSCAVTLAANGAAATATAGTIRPLLPNQLNAPINQTFWTASNVGTGTAQGGITHVPAGGTVVLCLSPSCGAAAQVILGPGGGTASNYTVTVASITGTANITVYGRSQS